ncbi:MAG: HlyC/CorC family transporter [Alphaproteobacteria bacterium]
MTIFIILFILFLIICAAFFSSAETAITGTSTARLYHLEEEGNKSAKLMNKLLQKKDQLIATILIGSNLVNVLSSALAANLLVQMFGDAGLVYATLIMTVMLLLFSEVLPKTYALYHADKTALGFAPVLYFLTILCTPFTLVLKRVTRVFMRLCGGELGDGVSELSDEELLGVISLHGVKGEDEKQEKEMLRGILDLDEVALEEIMIHRKNVQMLNADLPIEKIIEATIQSPYSRIPLWQKDKDNIVGVLHTKNLLRAVQETVIAGTPAALDIKDIASDPWFVSEATSLLDQLQAFRQKREHFSLVVDEYGAFMGVVTLEDILEEVVGDIVDESDIAMVGIRQQRDGSYVVRGDVTIRDLNRDLDWNLPDEEASTIAGLLLHETQVIPEKGKEYIFYNTRFEILRKQGQQILTIRIVPLAGPLDENDD